MQIVSTRDNIEASKALEKKALEQCNSEPIEWIERIQSHGSLIAFDFKSLIVTHVSDNLEKVVNIDAKSILNKSIRVIFSKEDIHDILNIATHASTKNQREHVKVIEQNDKSPIDVSLFRTDISVVLELIPAGTDFKYININNNIKWALAKTHGHENIEDILNNAVQSLQRITGFDRVMAYKFLPDNSGEVIAEAISTMSMNSFLGLRFPAFDIPPRARDLFLKNPIRVIRSTSDEGTKILVNNNSDNKLNLTYSLLRAAAPVHNQYLRNMDVSSSMTIPIIIDGKLWGLFAHHHNSLNELSPQETYSADILGQTINMVLEHQTRQKAQKTIKDILENGNDLIAIETNSFKLDEFWNAQAKNLFEIIPCDGIAYVIDKNIKTYGNCPELNSIQTLVDTLNSKKEELQSYTNISKFIDKGIKDTRGLIFMQLNSEFPQINMLFFRDKISKNVQWAGSPEKELIFEKENVRLHPRSSFKEYIKNNSEDSDIWTTQDLFVAKNAIETFKKYIQIEIDKEKKEVSESERLKILVKELNHRVRNILALVKSVSKQTASKEKSIESYVLALEKRITALADVNNMLTESSFGSINLKKILVKELSPFDLSDKNYEIKGPSIELASSVAPIIVLVLHELTTNSAKYGSLSSENGKLTVSWHTSENDIFIFWKEENGPKVTIPKHKGFGRTIIENAIGYEFGGSSLMNFKESGLEVTIQIPLSTILRTETEMFATEQIKFKQKEVKEESTELNILVLEDDFIIANQTKELIENRIASSVDIFSNQKSALIALEKKTYNFALLDVNLKRETSLRVAQMCNTKRIPFHYVTGYGDNFLQNDAFPNRQVLIKPISDNELFTIIDKLTN